MKKLDKILVVKLFSDNYNGELMTIPAYRELRLQMSSGDFGSHRVEYEQVETFENVITTLELEEIYEIPNNVVYVDFINKRRIS